MVRALTVAVILGLAAPASADILKLFAEAHGGGVVGITATADNKPTEDSAFFKKAPHLAYGVLVGAELLFLDAWIQHHQYRDSSTLTTWTQFGLGVHAQIDLSSNDKSKDKEEQKSSGKSGGFIELSAGLWFGLGTGQQVMPPLDNAQISDKAFLIEGRFGLGMHLGNIFDIGAQVPVSYGYFFKNGGDAAANDTTTHYQGIQAELLLFLRGNINLL